MRQISNGIWIFDGETVNFHSFPFSTRMTVVLLSDGDLWVHSPIRLNSSLREKVEALGRVKYIIAPNHLHHLYIEEWQKSYPDSLVYGTEEVLKKRNDISFDGVLGDGKVAPWRGEIAQLLFTGSPAMQECVFFHKASGVLVVTDLIENFSPEAFPFIKRQIARLSGILAPNGKMPIDWRLSFYPKRSEARQHIERILSWGPKIIVLSHGTIVEENADAFLRRSFSWVKLSNGTS